MSIHALRFTNSMTGKKELFEPKVPGKATFYSCGPTVYGPIHIGNLRAAMVADLIFKVLKRAGYEVNFVRNYTDVDDKIIKRAADEKKTSQEVADFYVKEVEKDYALAGLAEPTHKCRVTETLPEIIALIEQIVKRGHGYVADDGEVLFAIESFPTYGKLSGKNLEELNAGHRVEVSAKKRNPLDFTLWKPAKPGEPAWPSPWGEGRPGWHIECSAMSLKWIGDEIDVHHGGEDLQFPHHENEIAQSEAGTGHAPFVRVWLHNAFLNLSNQKMSKSLGNIVSARDFLGRYGGEVARYFCLGAHYRARIDLNDEAIEQAIVNLERIYQAKKQALVLSQKKAAMSDLRAESVWGDFLAEVEVAKEEINECYFSDLNTAGALGALFTLIRSFNRALAEPMAQSTPGAILASQQFIAVLEESIGGVIGIGRLMPEKALADLEQVMRQIKTAAGSDLPTEDEIKKLIQARVDARQAKNFAESDRIRNELDSRGVVIKDSPQGTTWTYKK